MTILCLIAFGSNTSYSCVCPILPHEVQSKGLSDFVTAAIISGYPLGMMLSTPIFQRMLDTIGQKQTLVIGVFALGASMVGFVFVHYLESYIFFIIAITLRIFMGFGDGCLNAATSSIIAIKYPEQMGFLIGLQQIFTNAGMLIGTWIGGISFEYGGFTAPFYLNGGLMILFGFFTAMTFPDDRSSATVPNQSDSSVSIRSLLQNIKVMGISCCMVCTLFSFTFKESIAAPELQGYYFYSTPQVANILMVEGVMFIIGSILVTVIPERNKNYSLFCTLGTIGFSIAMVLEAPFWGISASRSHGSALVIAGIGLGGFSGALIMPSAVPAMSQILEGQYQGEQDQMKNAMSSLVAGAFGLGNFVGTMLGGILGTIFHNDKCMVYITESGGVPQYNPGMKDDWLARPGFAQLENNMDNFEHIWQGDFKTLQMHNNQLQRDSNGNIYFQSFLGPKALVENGSINSKDCQNINMMPYQTEMGQYFGCCQMQMDRNGKPNSEVFIPANHGSWQQSVSIGAIVCMLLCVFQIYAYFSSKSQIYPRQHELVDRQERSISNEMKDL